MQKVVLSMKLSIIVPVYNGGKFAEKLALSLNKISGKDIEIIIVNDGSTDNTKELLENNISSDIILISKDNGGVSSARNLGIEKSTGDYIWFIDSDDEIYDGTTDFIIEKIKSKKDLYIFDFVAVHISGRSVYNTNFFSKINDLSNVDLINKIMLSSNFNAIWHKIFSSKIIKENNIKFIEGIKNGEDGMFLLDYCDKIENAEYIKKPIYLYYHSEFSATSNYTPYNYKGTIAVYEKRLHYCNKYSFESTAEIIREKFLISVSRLPQHIKRNVKYKDNGGIKEFICSLSRDEFLLNEYNLCDKSRLNKKTIKFYNNLKKKRVKKIYRNIVFTVFLKKAKRRFYKK